MGLFTGTARHKGILVVVFLPSLLLPLLEERKIRNRHLMNTTPPVPIVLAEYNHATY
jgi:hypothetical protein